MHRSTYLYMYIQGTCLPVGYLQEGRQAGTVFGAAAPNIPAMVGIS